MAEVVQVVPKPGLARNRWLASYEDGTPLFEIRLEISSMLNGSRFYIVSPAGDVVGDGTFDFGVWDARTRQETLAAIVKSKIHDAAVRFQEVA